MKMIIGTTIFGNSAKRSQQVFRTARRYQLGRGGAMIGSVGRLFPKVLLYWRARVRELTNKLRKLHSIHKTALFVNHQANIKFVNFPSAVALKNLSLTDQRGPFQYQTLVQNFLYYLTRNLGSALYKSTVFSKYREFFGRSSDKITVNVVQDSMLRWPSFSVTSKVSGTTSASHQPIKPISFIASALKSGFLYANTGPVDVPKLTWQARKGEDAQFVAAGHITTRRMYSASLRSLEENKLLFSQSFRFTSKSHPLRTLVSEGERENLFYTTPIHLNWRKPKYSRDGLQQTEVMGLERSLENNVNFAARSEQSIHTPPSFTKKSLNQTPEAIVKELWSESTLARLADDVMRRIDKRLRIERERRGLQ